MLKLRRAVRWWAERMEEELQKNEYKGGWNDEDYDYLLDGAKANLKEIKLDKIYGPNPDKSDKLYVIKCCADCANFCMMLADVIKG